MRAFAPMPLVRRRGPFDDPAWIDETEAVATPVSAASDAPDKTYMERLFAAWATMDTAKIAPFYAAEPTNTWFDVTPMQFRGWAEWAAGLRKLFAEHETFKLSVVGSARVSPAR